MKTIKDFDLSGKKVIIRVDFNVPMKDGVITNDNRIKASLKTIKYALDNNAKVILLSHLGRIKTLDDKLNNSLKPVSIRLSELLNMSVKFIPETRGIELENAISNMNEKDIILIENTRFEDLNDKAESSNNEELGKYWASLGDIFINDAFATAHRSHASNVGIATYLPSGIGFLIEEELKALDLDNTEKRLYSKPDFNSQIINTFKHAKDIRIQIIRGNWALVRLYEYEGKMKIGWIKWRTDEGKFQFFPNVIK